MAAAAIAAVLRMVSIGAGRRPRVAGVAFGSGRHLLGYSISIHQLVSSVRKPQHVRSSKLRRWIDPGAS